MNDLGLDRLTGLFENKITGLEFNTHKDPIRILEIKDLEKILDALNFVNVIVGSATPRPNGVSSISFKAFKIKDDKKEEEIVSVSNGIFTINMDLLAFLNTSDFYKAFKVGDIITFKFVVSLPNIDDRFRSNIQYCVEGFFKIL